MTELKQKLKRIIVEELNLQHISPDKIDDTASLFEEGLGLDSLDGVELVVVVQKYFGVRISNLEEGQEAFASIESLANYIVKKQGEKSE